MAKKKLSYWELRVIQEEEQLKQDSIKVEAKVRSAYQKAQSYLTGEVKKIYQRYLNKTDKTEAEVNQILNTSVEPAELVKLKQLTKDITNPQLKTESQNYLTGLAVKHRITRLEDLKAKSYLVSKQVANVQLDRQTDFYVDTIHDAYNKAAAESIIGHAESGVRATNDGKYKSWAVKDGKLVHELIDSESGKVLDTIKVTKNEPVTEFKELSTKYVRNILDKDWKGSNYSKRIWNDTELLAKRLEELFTVEAMTGMSEQEMIKAISKEFETSINVSRRLIRTEANYMANQAKLKSWQEHGVEEYVIVATLDFRTSETCQHQDGKRYKVADAVVSVNFPPFHPWCRTVVRAYFGERSLQGERIANNPTTGKTFKIKQETTYKEWEELINKENGLKEVAWSDEIQGINSETSKLINESMKRSFEIGKKENKELLSLIDMNRSKLVHELKGVDDAVAFSNDTLSILKKSGDNSIILNHNHPGKYNQSFSESDFKQFVEFKSINSMTLITSDGSKYLLDKDMKKISYFKKLKFYNNYGTIMTKYNAKYGDSENNWSDIVNDVNIEIADILGVNYRRLD